MPGTLFVVATPIGNLEDISARAIRILGEVALIAAEDTRRTAHLLARYAITTPTTSLHEHNEHQKTPRLLERLAAGESIAVVSDAGTPTVSDPGRRLVEAALEAGIKVEPIPGPSAAMAALAASGFSADTFTFLGFPPTGSKDRKAWFNAMAAAGRTVVFFEAPHRIRETLADMRAAVGDVTVFVGRELTKAHEELVKGPILSVLDKLVSPRGEFTVVAQINALSAGEAPGDPPSDEALLAEFASLSGKSTGSRRRVIAEMSNRYSLSTKFVYAAIERAKQSVK